VPLSDVQPRAQLAQREHAPALAVRDARCHAAPGKLALDSWSDSPAALALAKTSAACQRCRPATTCRSRCPGGIWSGSPGTTGCQAYRAGSVAERPSVVISKAARERAAGPVPAAGSALGGPPAAHRAAQAASQDQVGCCHGPDGEVHLPRSKLSSSRPPRLGRSLRSRRRRSASPTLDTMPLSVS
jgi:hypothetical protein